MKWLYTITLRGCDDVTRIKVYLNDEQVKLIENLSELSKQISTIPCKPIMSIKRGNI